MTIPRVRTGRPATARPVLPAVPAAVATAAAAAAADRPTTLFFTQGAVWGIAHSAGWQRLPVADPSLGGSDAQAQQK